MAAGGGTFLDELFDCFASFAGALLNSTEQFLILALDVREIVIRELGPLLFQLARHDGPIAGDSKFVHGAKLWAQRLPAMGLNPTEGEPGSRPAGRTMG